MKLLWTIIQASGETLANRLGSRQYAIGIMQLPIDSEGANRFIVIKTFEDVAKSFVGCGDFQKFIYINIGNPLGDGKSAFAYPNYTQTKGYGGWM